MEWIHLVILAAVIQLFIFGLMTGKARELFNVPAPATAGNVNFERYYRVHMNSIELFVLFAPSILLASQYWSPYILAILGVVYLLGRTLYFFAYTKGKPRTLSFMASLLPVLIFILAALVGTLRAVIYS